MVRKNNIMKAIIKWEIAEDMKQKTKKNEKEKGGDKRKKGKFRNTSNEKMRDKERGFLVLFLSQSQNGKKWKIL